MDYFKQPILENGAMLTAYLHDYEDVMPQMATRPAILICPGGGYGQVSPREGEAVALAFMNMGFHAFVLNYSVQGQDKSTPLGMQPLAEVACAIQRMREHHAEWRIIPDKIAVCGFSAGAHLAGSLGVLFADAPLCERLNATPEQLRPDAMILAYPVITEGEFAHRGSFVNLLGADASNEVREHYSLELQVTDNTPPTFLWHTVEDAGVPVENSLLMAMALRKHKVPFEMHLFEHGSHGLSICTETVNTPNPHAAHWVQLCEEWIKRLFELNW